ncbi:MAG TPA: hypothetical protein VH107_15845, partial [Lacipirellulaceae bacterium]|nr:hypothetical protein [Lacipirellulaceae bacterium]
MSQVAMIAEPIKPIDKIETDDLSFGSLAIPTDMPAILSAAQVVAGIRKRFDQLWALEVEDEFLTESFEDNDRLVPFGRHHYAFSGCKRLNSQSGQFVENGPCLFPCGVWAWNGSLQQNLQAFDQCAYLSAKKYDWVDKSFYLSNAGIPVGSLDEEIKRLKNSCMRTWVIELFDSRRRWKVLSNLEIVDGAHCHVLVDGGQYKMWIDPSLGFAARLFEIYLHAAASKAERPLLNRVVYRDFRHMHDDFWAPWL